MTVSDARIRRRLAVLDRRPPGTLLVHEVYRSVQGESTRAGLPCTFVRLTACDLRCRWCDTPHAFAEGEPWTLDAVEEEVVRLAAPMVELTGGEPLLQPEIHPLMGRLCDLDYEVLIETSGAADIGPVDPRVRVIMDLKCPDSGEHERNRVENLGLLERHVGAEVKLVVASRADFEWGLARVVEHRLDERFEVLVSAVWGQVEPRDLAAWVLASGRRLRLQLQLHKYVWNADARGV